MRNPRRTAEPQWRSTPSAPAQGFALASARGVTPSRAAAPRCTPCAEARTLIRVTHRKRRRRLLREHGSLTEEDRREAVRRAGCLSCVVRIRGWRTALALDVLRLLSSPRVSFLALAREQTAAVDPRSSSCAGSARVASRAWPPCLPHAAFSARSSAVCVVQPRADAAAGNSMRRAAAPPAPPPKPRRRCGQPNSGCCMRRMR